MLPEITHLFVVVKPDGRVRHKSMSAVPLFVRKGDASRRKQEGDEVVEYVAIPKARYERLLDDETQCFVYRNSAVATATVSPIRTDKNPSKSLKLV